LKVISVGFRLISSLVSAHVFCLFESRSASCFPLHQAKLIRNNNMTPFMVILSISCAHPARTGRRVELQAALATQAASMEESSGPLAIGECVGAATRGLMVYVEGETDCRCMATARDRSAQVGRGGCHLSKRPQQGDWYQSVRDRQTHYSVLVDMVARSSN
jgi:hypothetical protein